MLTPTLVKPIRIHGAAPAGLAYSPAGEAIGALTGLVLLVGALAGVGALYGHVAYGDWRCGFRTCVVPPGYHRGRRG